MSTSPVTPDILQRMGVNLAPVPTIPSSPLNNTIASIPMPQGPTFGMALPTTTQTSADQARRDYLVNSGSGIDQITHPVDAQGNPTGPHVSWGKKLLGGVARAGEIAGSVFAPGVVAAIPGTALHHQFLVNQAANNVATDQAEDASAAATAEKAAQTGEVQALGDKASAIADADTPAPLSAEDAARFGHPELAGLSISPRDRDKFFGTLATNDTKGYIAAGHDATRVTTTGMNDDTKRDTTGAIVAGRSADNAATNTTRESISDAANKTRVLVGQMHDATSQANNQNTNNHKAGSGVPGADGSFKVPADVTKRAALASNVTENADAVDSLIKSRPDIIGAAGGRYTNVQQMIGSNDPAIAELGVRIHNIALASNGAHGVRSSEAVAKTEDDLFNHFKSGPDSIHGSLNGTRASMQTFLNDESNFSTTGKRTGSAAPTGGKADFVFVPGKGLVKQ